ncbi:MAG: hypothetical protein J5I93_14990 [Pirellulaceae bacterium]|nr:hypothetical protein [Pirellulaceae bacterium]
MLRKTLIAVSLLLAGGCVVAFVNAQDPLQQVTEPGAAMSAAEPGSFPLAGEGDQVRPLSPYGSAVVPSGTFEGAEAVEEPRGGLQSVLKRPSRELASPAGGVEAVGGDGFTSRRPAPAAQPGDVHASPYDLSPPRLVPPAPPTLDDEPSPSDGSSAATAPTALAPLPNRLASRATALRTEAGSTALLSGESPAIRVDTRGPASITVGKQADYIVEVTNLGQNPVEGLDVALAIPRTVVVAGSEAATGKVDTQPGREGGQIIWQVDRLGPQASAQLRIRLVPQHPRAFALAVEWSVRPVVTQAEVQVLEPKLDLVIGGPKDILYGETKIYTLTLSNPGTGNAENVAITLGESPASGATRQLGTLAAGERRELDIELTARETGTMQIQALALADGGLRAQAEINVQVRRAILEVAVSGPPRRFAGSAATYAVRVANTGDAAAENVVASLLLPEGARLIGGLAGAQAEAGQIRWPVGVLNPGSEKQFQLQVELTLPGENRLEVRTVAGELTAASQMLTRVEALADLKLLVNDPRGPKSVGEEVVYEMVITNRGTKSARNVQVVAQFTEGIEPTRADGGPAELVPGQVLFQPLAEIAPGQKVVLSVVAKASKEGNHVFRASVNCADPETRLATEETTRFYPASVLGP